MSALNNLIQFAERLDGELLADFQQRVNAYMDERDRLQNERIAMSQATTGTFEVVAISGTPETILSDVTDTNVGEIKYGDTAVCIKDCYPINGSTKYPLILIGDTLVVDLVFGNGISFEGYGCNYYAFNFRKVSTPIVNPLNSVEGC